MNASCLINDPFECEVEQVTGGASLVDVLTENVHKELEDSHTYEEVKAFLEDNESLVTHKAIAEYSFIYFIKHYLSSHAYNNFAPVHYELAQLIQNQDPPSQKLLWIFPREHGKTTFVSFAYVLWCVLYAKRRNIVIFSDTQKQSTEFLMNIKTELLINTKIILDFGELEGRKANGGKWDERHIITANRIQVQAKSTGSQVRGMNFNQIIEKIVDGVVVRESKITRPDLFVLDDILNDKFIRNKDVRDKLEKWFFQALINALDSERGQLIAIGTFVHSDCLLSRLWKDNERLTPANNWQKRMTPACRVDEQGNFTNILWPSRWGLNRLKLRRKEIGSLAFNKEFLLNTKEEESKYFSMGWNKYYAHKSLAPAAALELSKKGIVGLPQDLLLCTAIDPNISTKEHADYTVVLTLGFSPATRGYYILDAYRGRPSPQAQIVEMIRQALKYGRQFNPETGLGAFHAFVVETVAYQSSIKFWLKKYASKKNIWPCRVFERHETLDKDIRVASVSPMAEQGRLYFPIGMLSDPVTGESRIDRLYLWLEEELDDYPQSSYKDGADALQRAYSGLIAQEKKYVEKGRYGVEAMEGFEVYFKSYEFMDMYQDKSA